MTHLQNTQRQFIVAAPTDLSNPSVTELISISNNDKPILSRTLLKQCVSDCIDELKRKIYDESNASSLINKMPSDQPWRMASHFPERTRGNNGNYNVCSNCSILFALYAFGNEF